MNENRTNHSKGFKVLTLIFAFVLVIGISVSGTLAWLTAKTGTVENTFTSAKLFDNPTADFTLWEHAASDDDNDGRYTLETDKATTAQNSYTILPGVDIPKDPTVTVSDLLEDAYLYIKVAKNTLPTSLTYELDACWTELSDYSGVYVYTSNGSNVVKAFAENAEDMNINILKDNKITVPGGYEPSGSATEPYTLSFEAYMVQATGNGNSAAEAWKNTYGNTTATE